MIAGHTRQGLKCRLCKMNVHLDCQEKVTTRCQTKSRLLRRQKSTSEIETRIVANMPEEEGKKQNKKQNFHLHPFERVIFIFVPRRPRKSKVRKSTSDGSWLFFLPFFFLGFFFSFFSLFFRLN